MELVISQLTRLGLSEVVMHLLGSKWSSNDLFDKSLEASTIFLDAGHVVTEENRIGKSFKRKSGTRMEHCSYRYSVLFDLIPLLMSSIESYLSNKSKQCVLKKLK